MGEHGAQPVAHNMQHGRSSAATEHGAQPVAHNMQHGRSSAATEHGAQPVAHNMQHGRSSAATEHGAMPAWRGAVHSERPYGASKAEPHESFFYGLPSAAPPAAHVRFQALESRPLSSSDD